ncbi:PPE domain-containing protein [Saccharothrix longispora]|uniref:PPE domain-containing protein n=1 Tax=Saccharothrix longispora TaxID=33920 RepID=A0ABU1PXX7_9PSEU|nr:PPE domain-containing protein [Saccharothrix longispora]MDR6595490.1 hypothetical protein [Saccharothrix longispora]
MNKRGARRVRKQRVRANRRLKNFGKINWRVYEHRQMWDMVMSAEVPLMATRTAQWQVLASAVDQATNEVQHIVRQLAESWRGPSAGAAADSVNRLTAWAADASERAYRVGNGLDTYTSALVEARARMPEPVHPTAERWFREGRDVSVLDGAQGAYMIDQLLDDHLPSKREQQRAHEEAVRVMTGFEDASRGVHDRLPEFEDAPAATRITPDHRSLPVLPPVPVPPPWVPPVSTRPPGPEVDDPSPSPFQPGPRPADTTAVASATGGPAGGPGGGAPGFGPGGTAAGHGYGAGGYGTGSGGFGPGGFGPGGPGGGAPGFGPGGSSGVLGAVPGGAAARGGVGPVTGAGGPQGFGMYPPTSPGGAREEDGEHRNRYDPGLDLLDDLPPAFPPVLGE